jgi:hypothetical protein
MAPQNPYQNPYAPNQQMSQENMLLLMYLKQMQQQQAQQSQGGISSLVSNATKAKGSKSIGNSLAEALGLGEKAKASNVISGEYNPEQAEQIFSQGIPSLGLQGSATPGSLNAGWQSAATSGPLIPVALATMLGAKGAKDFFSGKKTKGWEGWGGRATIGVATGGLSEVARLAGFGGKKSTADYDKERKEKVINKGNTGWADYYSKESQAPDKMATPAGIRRGADGSWVKEDGSWDAREYAGVQGNADTFGDDWFKLSDEQRDRLVTQFKDAGLYHKDKGDVLISDGKQAKARQMFDEVLRGTSPVSAIPRLPSAGVTSGMAHGKGSIVPWAQSTGQQVDPGYVSNWRPSSLGNRYDFGHTSKEYKSLSKTDKDKYWAEKNSGSSAPTATPRLDATATALKVMEETLKKPEQKKSSGKTIFGIKI